MDTEEIILEEKTRLVGVGDIGISKVDDTVFIASKGSADPGAINTIALYASEDGKIKSAGWRSYYEPEEERFNLPNLNVSQRLNVDSLFCNFFTTSIITTDHLLVHETIDGPYLSVNQANIINLEVHEKFTVGHFKSNQADVDDFTVHNNFNLISKRINLQFIEFKEKDNNNVFAGILTDNHGYGPTFAITTKKETGETGCALTIDNQHRVTIIDGSFNISKKRIINDSKGSPGDKKGDIAISDQYLYYCTRNYNGITSIWVRWVVTDKQWSE
jgi:hypothetical protein